MQDSSLAEKVFTVVPETNWTTETKVVDEAGKPKLMFHSTDKENFQGFHQPGKDIGIHFGDYQAAEARQTRSQYDHKKIRIVAAYLDIRNPIRLPDPGNWFPNWIVNQVRKVNSAVFPKEFEFKTNYSIALEENKFDLIRKRLLECGYDGIVYQNRIETEGQREFTDKITRLSKEKEEKINLDPENWKHYLPIREEYDNLIRQLYEERNKISESTTPTDSFAVFSPDQIKIQSIEPLKPTVLTP